MNLLASLFPIISSLLQRFIAIFIFVTGLFVFVSNGLPTIANSTQEAAYSFVNKSYASFALSILPVDHPLFPKITPTPELIKTEEVVPTVPPPAPNSYCLHVPIILYHHIQPFQEALKKGQENLTVDPSFFEMHMSYIRSAGYTPLTVDNLVDALQHKKNLPTKSIIVTLDDGYEDNYTYAYPILMKYNIIANFMIPAGLMEKEGYLSWGQISEMLTTGQKMYNHTWSHAPLGYISKEQIVQEVSSSGKKLEEATGSRQHIFTYPYGSFNEQAITTLKDLGYSAALTTVHGRQQCDSNLMTLYREHVGNTPLSSYGL